MSEKYLMFSIDDEKARNLGEVIANPTCKKIVSLLAEKDHSQSDIARELKLPLNTIDYNIKKLLEAGIIEKSRNFFWSSKGKKIEMYKVANKLIVIQPKKTSAVYSKLKSIIPVVLISGILTGFVSWYYKSFLSSENAFQKVSEVASDSAGIASQTSEAGRASIGSGISQAADSAREVIIPNLSKLTNTANEAINSSNAIPLFSSSPWAWFAIGSLVTIIAFLLWNWRKL